MKDFHERKNAIEINDLIADAIANAAERRHQTVLSDLSEEELAHVEGGSRVSYLRIFKPIIMDCCSNPLFFPNSAINVNPLYLG